MAILVACREGKIWRFAHLSTLDELDNKIDKQKI